MYHTATNLTPMANQGSAYGWDRGGAAHPAEHPAAADTLQRPLRSHFRQRLKAGVGPQQYREKHDFLVGKP